MAEAKQKVKLGELLVEAQMVSSGDLMEAIQVSRRLGVPIGRVLLVSGCVTPEVLETALEAQSLINTQQTTRQSAMKALTDVARTGRSLRSALKDAAPEFDYKEDKHRLADLLLDAGVVSSEQIDQAMMTSDASGMPLGSALVLEGVLSPSVFPSIMQIQRRIKEGKLSRDDGISELKSTFEHWLKAEESLSRSAQQDAEMEEELIAPFDFEFEKSEEGEDKIVSQPEETGEKMKLVDLLKLAGAVNQGDIQKAYESVLNDPERSAQLLLFLQAADEETLQIGLRCHGLLVSGKIGPDEAVKIVQSSLSGNLSEELEGQSAKVRRYFDKEWRKSTLTKVAGGAALGFVIAGLSIIRKGK